MHYKAISFITVIFFTCSGMICLTENEVEASVFSRSVARVAARKAARKTASRAAVSKVSRRSIVRKSTGTSIAQKPAKHSVSSKGTLKQRRAREAARDNKTPAKPLEKNRTVRRYTSLKDARNIKAHGVSPKTHMTARIPKGRPISAKTAQKRYGLERKPEARLTIRIPKGHPAKKNKVMYNAKGGWGEITSPKHNPATNVLRIDRIH